MYMRERNTKHGASGTPYYVGKGHGDRAYSRKHRVSIPPNPENIVFVAQGMSEKDAHQLEMLLIAVYGRLDIGTGCLANLTDGGQGQCGAKYTDGWRQKISQALKGVPKPLNARTRGPRSRERIAQMSEAQKRRYQLKGGNSTETIRKRAESLRQGYAEGRIKRMSSEQASRMARKPKSEEARKNIGAASKRRVWSPETCKKRSESLLAYHARKRGG
jgi:hypothetical protein